MSRFKIPCSVWTLLVCGSLHLVLLLWTFESVHGGTETVRIGLIVVKSQAEAQRLLGEIRNGGVFSELARKHSIGPGAQEGGDLGEVRIDELIEPLQRALKGIEGGGLSPVFRLPQGFAILKVFPQGDGAGGPNSKTIPFVSAREAEAKGLLEKGVSELQKGEWDQAMETLKRSIALWPENADAHSNLGLVCMEKGLLEEAISAYRKALELRPDSVDARLNLGVAYSGKGEIDRAIEEFRKVIEMAPENGKAHNNLAIAYFFKGEFPLAIRHCDRAIELGASVHPQFLKELEPHRGKISKP